MGDTFSKAALKLQATYGLPNWVTFQLMWLAARICGYWSSNVFLYLVYRFKLLHKYKIQGDRVPSQKLVMKSIEHNVVSDLFSFAPSLLMYYVLTMQFGSKNSKQKGKVVQDSKMVTKPEGKQEAEEGEEKIGWANVRLAGKSPSLRNKIWTVVIGYLGYDFMFYWSHRMLHLKAFYIDYHKKHHRFHTPIGAAAMYETPLEGLIQLFNWYIPIGVAGAVLGELHPSSIFWYHLFRWFETVDAHCGYELPFSPFHIIPLFGGATAHDGHHRHFFGNYGATNIWDWVCGTNLVNELAK